MPPLSTEKAHLSTSHLVPSRHTVHMTAQRRNRGGSQPHQNARLWKSQAGAVYSGITAG